MIRRCLMRQRSFFSSLRLFLLGKPLSVYDSSIFHRLALIPFLAWVGLGADGLSSSAYGPSEAFLTIGDRHYLALPLALMTAFTVFVIATAYSALIEAFPAGGGGYIVASKLLGPTAGVVSGSALLVDYVLTIAVSIAAAGDALFSLMPTHLHGLKVPVELFLILALIVLNLRGVKESVLALLPVFILFLITHALLLGGALVSGLHSAGDHVASVANDFHKDASSLGFMGIFLIFLKAYSMGGGTYTGLEAVSNGLPIMREPRVHTGRRTMFYMAASLSIVAGGLFLGYFFMGSSFVPGKTLNAVLAEQVFGSWRIGGTLVLLLLVSEGALLIVGAQAGFIDGPRILANMALDGWMPRRFSSLSDRLTAHDGILLMGAAAIVALLLTHGSVEKLVVMYSINVFLTFSLSMVAMLRSTWKNRVAAAKARRRNLLTFGVGSVLCISILLVTIYEKTESGGWMTIMVTSCVVALAMAIKRHYRAVAKLVAAMDSELPESLPSITDAGSREFCATKPTAIVLVGGYQGVGIKLCRSILSTFPDFYKNVIFISVGIVDSGTFKGIEEVENLKQSLGSSLAKYEALACGHGFPVRTAFAIGIDPVDVLEKLCMEVSEGLGQAAFFAGQIVFEQEQWFHAILHNQTAFSLQKRLLQQGKSLIVLPLKND
jgi:amino acid transporter